MVIGALLGPLTKLKSHLLLYIGKSFAMKILLYVVSMRE